MVTKPQSRKPGSVEMKGKKVWKEGKRIVMGEGKTEEILACKITLQRFERLISGVVSFGRRSNS